ncbi:MFS transporter [Jiella marina]|uniref:MFS transporter n=1 Tax=Jiella sp. LLJ827 TaxID=2917712 RepID=UPI002100CAAE|nr:MFS transporter [Jiella sp. LLJ827]
MTTADMSVGAQGAPTLAVVSAATMLVLVIFTVPLTTIEPTAAALAAGPGAQAWLLSAMPLGAATGLLSAGALGDDRGRRTVFLFGLAVMAAASVAGAFAPTPLVLILARIVQGLGGAAVMACGLGLLGRVYPGGQERTRATAVWAASLGAGVATGPILAALMTSAGGWTASYWGDALASFALLAVGHRVLPADETSGNRRVDWFGAALLMAGLALVMAGLTEMRLGIGRPLVLGLLFGGLALLAGFVFVEARRRDPLLDLRLFRSGGFVGATVAAFASGAGILALMSLVPVLMSRAMGVSAITAGIVLCAWSATSVVTAFAGRWIPESWSRRMVLAGGLGGCALAQLLVYGPSVGGSIVALLPGLFLAGVANGVLNAALGQQAVATVPADRTAMGSGANNTARYLGSAIGITIGAVLIAHGAEVGGAEGLVEGWDEAVLITAGFSILGAIVVALAREQ